MRQEQSYFNTLKLFSWACREFSFYFPLQVVDLWKSYKDRTEFPYICHPISVCHNVIILCYHGTFVKSKLLLSTKLQTLSIFHYLSQNILLAFQDPPLHSGVMSLVSSGLGQFLSLRFSWPWQCWGILIGHFADCPSERVPLMFSLWLVTGVMGKNAINTNALLIPLCQQVSDTPLCLGWC